jgi:Hus1-like protein
MRFKAEFKAGACTVVAAAVARGAAIFGAASEDVAYLRFAKTEFTVGFAGAGDRVECWLKFAADVTFSENLICESIRGDLIDMTVLTGNLIATLKHAARAKQVTLRLSRGAAQDEIMVVELRFTAGDAAQEKLLVLQNMPVSIVRDPGSIKDEPRLPDPTCKFELLGLSRLREVLDKMKVFKIASCEVSLSPETELIVTGSSDGVSVEATFGEIPVLQGGEASASFPVAKLSLLVSHFSGLPVSGCTAALLADEFYLCLFTGLESGLGSFTAILPALIAS